MSKNKKDIIGVYEELKGVLSSIKDNSSWFDDEGFTNHTNIIITRAVSLCPEFQDTDYKLKLDHIQNRGPIVNTIQAKSKLNALIGRLKGQYDLEMPTLSNNGHTFIQNQSQTQSQNLTIILELQEKIILEIPKHTEGTKERSFLEKLKSTLPTIKNITDILSLVLKIGAEFELDIETIRKLLGL